MERGRRCGDGGAGTYAPRTYVHIGGIFHRDQDVAVATKIARIESTSALGGGVGGGITAAAGRGGVAAASAAAAAAAAAAKNSFAMEVAASPVPEVVVDNTAPAYASLMANVQNLTAAPRLDDGAAQAQQMQAQAQQAQQAEQAQQAQHMCGCSFVLSGHVVCVHLPLDSQVWRRWQLPN